MTTIGQAGSASSGRRSGGGDTLDARLRAQAIAHPDRPAVLDDAGTLSYGALDAAVSGLAVGLQRRGVIPGEHVALLLGNARDCLIAYFAVVRAGAVPVPLQPGLPGPELQALLAHCDAAVVLAEAGSASAVAAAVLPARRYVLAPAAAAARLPSPPAGWTMLAAEAGAVVPPRISPTDVAALYYTSGTTGRPKAVLHSHEGLIRTADVKAAAYGLRPDTILFCSPPLHHAAGWVSAVLVTLLAAGGAVALTRRRESAWVADLLAARRVTFVWTVPTTYLLLLALPDLAARNLAALEVCHFAALPMPQVGFERLRAVLPHARLLSTYGSTEANGGTIIQGDELLARPGSVGRPLEQHDVRVVDPAGRDCPAGRAGEVLHRGPGLMLGYYNDPRATATVLKNGWLRSGDAGYLDGDGYLYLLGRLTEVITWGGEKISPAEVEDALLRHPAVREAAVLGLPDPYYRQVVAAVVALHQGADVTAAQLQAHCGELLAAHKQPAHVAIVGALPRNAAGKVQKHRLLATLQAAASGA